MAGCSGVALSQHGPGGGRASPTGAGAVAGGEAARESDFCRGFWRRLLPAAVVTTAPCPSSRNASTASLTRGWLLPTRPAASPPPAPPPAAPSSSRGGSDPPSTPAWPAPAWPSPPYDVHSWRRPKPPVAALPAAASLPTRAPGTAPSACRHSPRRASPPRAATGYPFPCPWMP